MNEVTRKTSEKHQIFILLVGLGLLYILAYIFSPDNLSFYNVSPHPYFIVSCVLAIYYGLTFAFNFSFIVSCQYLLLLHLQTDYKEIDTIFDFRHLSFPVLVIIVSCFFGEIRSKFTRRLDLISAHDNEVDDSNQLLIETLTSLQEENFKLKKQIVSKLETFQSVLRVAQGFQSLDFDKLVTFYFQTLTKEVEAERAVIYHVNEADGFLEVKAEIGSTFEARIDSVDVVDALILNTLSTGEASSVGDLTAHDLEGLKEEDSLIVIPVVIRGEIEYLLAIYEMPFLNFGPSNIELINILTDWLRTSLIKSYRFSGLVTNSIFNDQFGVYTFNYLKVKIAENFMLKSRYGHQCQIFVLRLVNLHTAKVEYKDKLFKLLLTEIESIIRSSDILCHGQNFDEVFLLCPYLEESSVAVMKDKIDSISESFKEDGKVANFLLNELSVYDFAQFDELEDLYGALDV